MSASATTEVYRAPARNNSGGGSKKKTPTAAPAASPPAAPTTRPPLMVKPEYQAFARKLKGWLLDRQMRPADLARAIWGTTTDPRGYEVAKNRDRIGTYLAGTGYPTAETMKKLAEALGVDVSDLPEPQRRSRAVVMQPTADLTFSMLTDPPGAVSLTVRCIVCLQTAMEVVSIIEKDPLRKTTAESVEGA